MNTERRRSPLRGRRAELGLSQDDIAAHLECDRSLVSLIENGRHEATDADKAKIAALLKCRVRDIFPKSRAA
jgi:DNA-binding XRE family transcriptional regulator